MVLMMAFGINVSWGQADYSGTYYIASHDYNFDPSSTNNYYLCPTEGWAFYVSEGTPYCTVQGDDNGQPFLTTYQIKKNNYDVTKAKWTLTKIANSDKYYIQQTGTSNYIVTNGPVNKNLDRARVHLETINNPNDLNEKAQFTIYPYNGHMVIKTCINEQQSDVPSGSTHFGTHDDHKWFTVNQGNKPNLDGTNAKTDGPSSFPNTGGIIGIFTESDTNADFYLEDVITRPTITINSSNLIEITAAQTGEVTIKYTTDDSDPASNGTEYNDPFELGDNMTVKAVAIVSGEVSNVATFQRRLIQNQNNGWNENTEFYFYMTQGNDDKVNTTSMFRPSMEWYLIDAKNGFNYIVNGSNNKYLYYDGTNVSLTDYNSANDNNFKFGIRESPTAGTFNICPYSQNILYKVNGNEKADVLSTWVYSNDHFNSGNARWKFILPSNLDTTPPFTVSTTTSTNYYHIENFGNSGHYIVPPTGNNTNATTSASADAKVVKSGSWYFVVAQEPSSTDWCTYYHIRNAVTGEYLYFTKDVDNYTTAPTACLEMRSTIETNQEDRYLFTWARTATTGTYYIIPKKLKDVSLNYFGALRKHDSNTSILTNVTRGADRFAWTFTDAELFCNNPVFDTTAEKITISCNTNASEIFYTEDSSTPDSESTKYTSSSDLSASEQRFIKAIAICGTAQSEIVTLLNKPDITLEEGPYSYNGTAWEPGVTEVSITSGTDIITAPTSPATYSVTYSDNTDAGDATVEVNDANAGDTWYILNASKTFTINHAEVTVKADDKDKVYEEPSSEDPTLTATITGMVNNEPESLIAYTISRESGEEAGLYTITPTGETVQGNYHVTYETGVFQIGKEITPAPTISLTDWTYGSPNEPSVLGNAGGGEVTYYYKVKDAEDDTYTEEIPRNVGDYTVKAEIARTSEYFGVTTGSVDFKINKAPLTIVADAITKDYLDEDPELTYTVSGIKYNEDRSTVLACELQRAAGEAKGQYAITKKSHNLISGNYNAPSFTGAMFTIIAKNLGDPVTLEPTSGISIYAKDNGNDSWTVSVYTGKTPFIEGTDYNSVVTGPDDNGNYTITVTAIEPSNCRGTAQATYSPSTFYDISGTTEKFIPYISTTSDLTTSSDLVPYIVTQVNPSIGTVSIVPISYIPKDEPVLLLAASDVTGITTSPKNPATTPISESLISINKLNIAPDEPSDPDNPESVHGVHVEATEAYMFYIGEFVLTTEGTIKPGRYYLYNPMYRASADPGTPSPALARSLAIVKNETTGVIQLTNDEVKEDSNGVWYSIDGQKINKKPTRKGIYIQKGKKLILK